MILLKPIYKKAQSGTMVAHPQAAREMGFQDYQTVTALAANNLSIGSKGVNNNPISRPASISSPAPSIDMGLSSVGSGWDPNAPMPGANNQGSRTMKGVQMGMSTGSSIGSMFGPMGSVIGGAAGAVAGAVGSLFGKKKRDKKAAEKATDFVNQRRQEEEGIKMSKNAALRNFYSNKTSNYMSQAESLYGGNGKTVGIARRGGILYSPVQVLLYDNNIPLPKVYSSITPEKIRKATKGAKVKLEEKVILCSRVDKSCALRKRSEIDTPVFRRGGSLKNKFKPNIIPHGVYHEEENRTGVKGDKGLPIVQNKEKMFELEKSEWVLNADTSKWVEDLVKKYQKEPSEDILLQLGAKVREEILNKTYSYDEQYAHLND